MVLHINACDCRLTFHKHDEWIPALSSHKGWSMRTMKRKLQWVVVFLWKTSSMRWRRSVTMPQGLQRSETNSHLRARSLQMSSLHFWAYRLVITQHLSKVYTVLRKSLKPHLIGLHLCFQGARLTCHFLKLFFISSSHWRLFHSFSVRFLYLTIFTGLLFLFVKPLNAFK